MKDARMQVLFDRKLPYLRTAGGLLRAGTCTDAQVRWGIIAMVR